MKSSTTLGYVTAIFRYPVKSMAGESLAATRLTTAGIAGDRAYALFDPQDRKVGSAKKVDVFPRLLDCRARYLADDIEPETVPPVEITLPDGAVVRSEEPASHGALESWFGRPVGLGKRTDSAAHRPQAGRYAMAGTFFDYAPLHLLTDVALASLTRDAPQSRVAVERFRPNVMIAMHSGEAFPENSWVGQSLRIGAEIIIKVTDPCPRCALPTLQQGELPRDPALLKSIAAVNTVYAPVLESEQPCLGAYAFVVQPGVLQVGDRLELVSSA